MRHEAGGEAEGMTHLVQEVAELTNQCLFGERACQEASMGRQRIEGAKEAQALNEFPNNKIYRSHAFVVQFAKRHMHRPLIRAGAAEAVDGQTGALSDAVSVV